MKQYMDNEPIKSEILEGIAQYAFLHAPDKGNPKHRIPPSYKIDLMLVDEAEVKKAEAQGLNIKDADTKHPHNFVSIRSKVKEGRKPPRVIDSQRNPVPKEILVGNGSKVRVRYIPYHYGEGEVTPILQEVQVISLVEYKPTDGEIAKKGSFLNRVEGGFTVTPPQSVGNTTEPVA